MKKDKQHLLLRFSLMAFMLTLMSILVKADISYNDIDYNAKIDGIHYQKTSSLYMTVRVIYGREKYSGNITIPSSITYRGKKYFVTSIDNKAFNDCTELTKITFSEGITYITGFSGCTSLTELVIPNSVETIGNKAFAGCTGLRQVTIGTGVKNIYDSAFEGCTSLTKVNYNATNCKEVGINGSGITSPIFAGCSNLSTVNIGANVEIIPSQFLFGCASVTTINFGRNITTIGNFAFHNCAGLTEVQIPNSVEKIGYDAFSGCTGLTQVTIPNSITEIDFSTFEKCTSLTQVTIPNSVGKIGFNAFSHCTSLTQVTIGKNVNEIGRSAFEDCTKLESITSHNPEPPLCGIQTFDYVKSCILYVPEGSKTAYSQSYGWDKFTNVRIIGENEKKSTSASSSISQTSLPFIVRLIGIIIILAIVCEIVRRLLKPFL